MKQESYAGRSTLLYYSPIVMTVIARSLAGKLPNAVVSQSGVDRFLLFGQNMNCNKLIDMQKFFILVYIGCDPIYDIMTADQLSADEMFVRIIEVDKKFGKNVCEGTVVVERPDRRSVFGGESLVLKDVKYVKATLIRYQRDEAKKTLATLKNGLKCSDIAGGCGVVYFMNQWESLKKKYEGPVNKSK